MYRSTLNPYLSAGFVVPQVHHSVRPLLGHVQEATTEPVPEVNVMGAPSPHEVPVGVCPPYLIVALADLQVALGTSLSYRVHHPCRGDGVDEGGLPALWVARTIRVNVACLQTCSKLVI